MGSKPAVTDPAGRLIGMNLILTDACPFRCPQCYVPLSAEPRILPKEKALRWIEEAQRSGIRYVNMSGGETLSYPCLDELVRECARRGLEASVSISGAFATRDRLRSLLGAGVAGICVSLNGSTRDINEKTRQGYGEAVAALRYLKEIMAQCPPSRSAKPLVSAGAGPGASPGAAASFGSAAPGCTVLVNYVMHGSNAGDLPSMLRLLEEYQVYALVILGAKPGADGTLPDPPSAQQIAKAAEVLAGYTGPVRWLVNGCFSDLRSLLPGRHALDAEGEGTGCSAGLTHVTVTADGLLAPCNHLMDRAEAYDTIEAYLASSPQLLSLRARCRRQPGWKPCYTTLAENRKP